MVGGGGRVYGAAGGAKSAAPWQRKEVFTRQLRANPILACPKKRAYLIPLFSRCLTSATPLVTTTILSRQNLIRTLAGGIRSWPTTLGPKGWAMTRTILLWTRE